MMLGEVGARGKLLWTTGVAAPGLAGAEVYAGRRALPAKFSKPALVILRPGFMAAMPPRVSVFSRRCIEEDSANHGVVTPHVVDAKDGGLVVGVDEILALLEI